MRRGLSGRVLSWRVGALLVFRACLLSSIQLENRIHADLPDTLFASGLLTVVFAAAQLALHLDVSALGQLSSKL
jgi:hypothetical protein